MTDRDERLAERVAALERTITDGHADDGLPDAARMDSRLDDIEATVAALDDRMAELDAAVQALRGFAGGVKAVDEAVERRADAAVARVDRLESDLQAVRAELNGGGEGAADASATVGAESEHDGTHTPSQHGAHDDSGGAFARTERADRHERGNESAAPDRHGNGRDHGDSPTADGPDRRPSWPGSDSPESADADEGVQRSAVAARTDAALAEAAAMADEPTEAETEDGHTLAERIRRLL